MNRKLEDLIDIPLLQSLQDKLNTVYSFPSAILDIDGKILTAVAWQDICTKFHRINPESEKECIKSDKYILEHLHEANPAVSYKCPHGLVDNATPIIIDGMHLGNFFTGQFFLEKPDLEFFRNQAKVFGFDEKEYLAAVARVPVWTKEKLDHYIDFIKEFIEIVAGIGLKNLKEIEINNQLNRVNSELEIANKKLFEEIEEHRQTAEAQLKSEELFRTVFEFSTVGKSLTSPEGKLIIINKAFADMLGYTLDEMTNINFSDITHPDDIAESREVIRSLIAKEKDTCRFEKRYFHKNGSIVWTDVSTTVLCDNSDIPLYFITSIQDISKRKEAEEKLFVLAERHAALLSAIPDIVMEVDENKIYTWANKSGIDFFGEDVVGREAAAYFEGEQETYNIVSPLFKGDDNVFYVESWQRRKDGEKRLLGWWCRVLKDEDGNVTGALSSAQDITIKRLSEEVLRESEAKFRIIFDQSPVGALIVGLDKHIIKCNSSFCNFLGYSEDELIGKTVADITFPEDVEIGMKELSLIVQRKMDSARMQKRYLKKDGSIVWGEISIRLICDSNNVPVYFLPVVQDITEKKLAEAALISSEEKFRMAFEINPDGATITRLSDGVFLSINEGFTSLLGISESEAIDKSSLELGLWADQQDRINIVNKLRTDGTVKNYEAMFHKITGELVIGLMSASIVDLNGTRCMLSFTRDITERKNAETLRKIQYNITDAMITVRSLEELCETIQKELGTLFDTKNFFIALYDEKTDTLSAPFDKDEKENIPVWSAANSLSGYVIRQKKSVLLNSDEAFKLAESEGFQLIGARSESWLGVPLEYEGKILGVVAVQSYENKNAYDQRCVDIMESVANQLTIYIEHTKAEEALRNSEIRYRTLFNEAPVMVWEEDFSETKQYLDNLKLKGISHFDAYFETNPDELLKFLSTVKILNVNNATLSFYQAPNLEYLKQNFAQIFTEESFQVFKKAIINLADNHAMFEEEVTQRTFSGQIRNVHMRVFLPESEANTFSRVIVVMIDITERLQAQKEIQQANEELAELIAQKDKFFSIIAHDLKSPFQGFLGLTEIMAADASSFTIKELNEFSHRINKSATVLYELLVNLLEWAQIQRGAITCKPEGLNLLEITFKTTDTLRAVAAQKEIKIDTAVPESMEIFADEKMINSVIRNLLSNAIKFTPRGGGVFISAKETDSGKVVISVSDNGVGMSDEYSRKLFKFDKRVGSEGTENEPSSGLGLLLCKEFVEKNNGEIWVESEPGKGSIFHFTIPSGRGT
ncbi:MAG: PAS domain S-box protein [Ignavibacteriaceae bacterium]